MPRDVTLHAVAEAAGVSLATASRALAGTGRVSAQTVATVRRAAAELGYRVDPIARALRAGSTRIVGMIVPVIGNPFFAQLVDAVEQRLHEEGFELLLADSHGELAEEARRLAVFDDRRVDGILAVPSDRRRSGPALAGAGSPVVQVDRTSEGSATDAVGVDNQVGMRLALEHVGDRGARTLTYVGADDVTSNGVERFEAFSGLIDRMPFEAYAPIRGEFSVASGAAAADELVGRGALPDAVVTASDLIAFGLVARLREHGVVIPRDVLVTGFDGIPFAEIFSPGLTTVAQPVDAIAADAIGFLLARMRGDDSPVRRSLLAPTLVVRGSTTRDDGPVGTARGRSGTRRER
ncbi:LacI family DNA-binding transcriptional regulator [Microbacterium sp. ASV49]|uniref:LacI family DNA-binding transcriptional regulator n=1 Tax=Microbacterium candidum TaxID=3041922 RepID=A0ABT7MVF3_9MICO|nr:LacI family DNA-binding transcriptional regulator [Microbacterium sp. ASV49]MDL9978422.1 LacI family DNA-binding transcriptional regulator [Microbacterium sp. ASV49]